MSHTYKTEGIEIRKACLEIESLFVNWSIDDVDIQDMVLAIDEALTNIKEHGYENVVGLVDIEVSLEKSKVDIFITDNAKPFSLDDIHDVDKATYLESDQIGGFGVKIIKTLMDSVKQSRSNGQNLLVMSKNVHIKGPV